MTGSTCIILLSLLYLSCEGYFKSSFRIQRKNLLKIDATTDNRVSSSKADPSAYSVVILGDLHLNPLNMDDHINGRDHFKKILKNKEGILRQNTCVVSLGDLGETKPVHPGSKTIFSGTTECFQLARDYLDGFGAPFEVVGGNHDLEGIDEFPTDETNLNAYLRILGKETAQFKRLIAPKTLLIGLGSTVFREARYTSHEVIIDDAQVIHTFFLLIYYWIYLWIKRI
jgi:Calcineurin-like phosphoesterase